MKRVTLHNDAPDIFAAALQFMYYGTYDIFYEDQVMYMAKVGTKSNPQIGAYVNVILDGGLRHTEIRPAVSTADLIKPEKELALHLLAQKYLITDLATQTLEAVVSWEPLNLLWIELVFSDHIDVLHLVNPRLRQFLGKKIAEHYTELRDRKTESANIVYKWLEQDFELAMAVFEGFYADTNVSDPSNVSVDGTSTSTSQSTDCSNLTSVSSASTNAAP